VDPSKVSGKGSRSEGFSEPSTVRRQSAHQRGVLNVPGGTFADIAVTSPPSRPLECGPRESLAAIAPGTSQFLQFVQVAKWGSTQRSRSTSQVICWADRFIQPCRTCSLEELKGSDHVVADGHLTETPSRSGAAPASRFGRVG